MASQLITKLLHEQGIENIDLMEFHDCKNYNSGSVNKTVVVTFTDSRDDLNLFLKICQEDSHLKTVDSKLLIYDKEISFYTNILPSLITYQERNISSSRREEEFQHLIGSLFFKCFGSGCVGGDVYILFEKFSDESYHSTPKDALHSKEQIDSAMRSIATFHAVSYTMKVKESFNFITTYPILNDRLFNPESECDIVTSFYAGSYRKNLKVIKAFSTHKNELPLGFHGIRTVDINIIERLENLSDNVMQIFHYMCEFSDESAVLCHGDFHMGNIAFNKKETITATAKLFDFQLIRYASGLTDVHQYLYQVCTPDERDICIKDYLLVYSDAFNATCREIGLPDEKNIFNFDYVMKEYKRTSPWGFLFGFMFLMYRFVPNEIYSKATSTDDEDEIVNILKEVDSFMNIYKIYIDLVHEAESAGVIDLMEKYAS